LLSVSGGLDGVALEPLATGAEEPPAAGVVDAPGAGVLVLQLDRTIHPVQAIASKDKALRRLDLFIFLIFK
jgi:hypothetical protein